MTTFKLAVIVGSLKKESINLKLAKAIAGLGQGQFDAQFVDIGALPLFSEDLEGNPPAAVATLKQSIESADAVLFVTPEYNRSVPGVLKNALDWASRPYGKNSFAGKPAALCGASPGGIGSACAQQHLRAILGYLDVTLMGAPEVYFQFKPDAIAADGTIASDDSRKFLQKFTDNLVAWVHKQKA